MTTNRWLLGLWMIALVIGSAGNVHANAAGKTGRTTSGCNACHSGGTAPTVTITGPTSVTVDSTNEYLLQVFDVGSQHKGGLDAGATGGALSVGGTYSSGTWLSGTEITHNAAKSSDGTSVKFSFLWTAPASTGTYTLQAAGLAADGNALSSNDRGSTTTLSITVNPAPTVTATATPSRTATPTATATPTQTAAPSPTTTTTATATPTLTTTATPTATATATPTPTATATTNATATAIATPTVTPTDGTTPSATATASPTESANPTGTPTPTMTPTPDPCASAHCLNCSDICDCADAKPGVCIGFCGVGACADVGGACACQELPTPTLTATPTVAPTPPLDHFTCYKAGATKDSVKFAGIEGVALNDDFGPSTVAVKKPKFLCAPTNKQNEDPTAPDHSEHLEGYQVKPAAKRVLPTNLKVADQFNPSGLMIDLKKESHLLVPTAKSLSAPPSLPGAFLVDHFQCYKASISKGAAKFAAVSGVTTQDQFGALTVEVKKPRYLCVPVDKNGEGIHNPASHLMCYQVKQVSDPKFAKVIGAYVNNQFGPEQLDAKTLADLCVPATTTP